jgi:glycosyltransferase involved in cell wall biosynthesis
MGGEAILPLHYFRFLRRRNIEAWLVVHERVRKELEEVLSDERHRIYYIRETLFQTITYRLGTLFPGRVAWVTLFWLVDLSTGRRTRSLARKLVAQLGIDVVHQPTPVSPRQPSYIFDVGAPVIIGPMNGGMTFPAAFAGVATRSERTAVRLARVASDFANRLLPGKGRAALLLVANQRTAAALPSCCTRRVAQIAENGVDLALWRIPESRGEPSDGTPANAPVFTFLGFLKDWKAVDIMLEAGARMKGTTSFRMQIIGDGPERPRLQALAARLGIGHHVEFLGFVPQVECPPLLARSRALVLPSVYECGGAVVLEAMSSGVPVIATAWGGPTDYLRPDCGFLIAPSNRSAMVEGFANAMKQLAEDPNLAALKGRAGRRRVEEHYDWERKIDQILGFYRGVIDSGVRP